MYLAVVTQLMGGIYILQPSAMNVHINYLLMTGAAPEDSCGRIGQG